MGVTIDANIMRDFSRELDLKDGAIHRTVLSIVEKHGLAIDAGGIMLNEWTISESDHELARWVQAEMIDNRIREVKARLDAGVKRNIVTKYGMPSGHRDMVYIKCANASIRRYIVSEDMDLYDPKKKKAKGTDRERLMNDRRGPLCKFLKKTLSIEVGMLCHCSDDLELDGG